MIHNKGIEIKDKFCCSLEKYIPLLITERYDCSTSSLFHYETFKFCWSGEQVTAVARDHMIAEYHWLCRQFKGHTTFPTLHLFPWMVWPETVQQENAIFWSRDSLVSIAMGQMARVRFPAAAIDFFSP
jgi:hypothetical protein